MMQMVEGTGTSFDVLPVVPPGLTPLVHVARDTQGTAGFIVPEGVEHPGSPQRFVALEDAPDDWLAGYIAADKRVKTARAEALRLVSAEMRGRMTGVASATMGPFAVKRTTKREWDAEQAYRVLCEMEAGRRLPKGYAEKACPERTVRVGDGRKLTKIAAEANDTDRRRLLACLKESDYVTADVPPRSDVVEQAEASS